MGLATSVQGSVTLQNQSNSGTIAIQTGAHINSQQLIGDSVSIFIGSSASQAAGPTPTNVTASTPSGGLIYFGTGVVSGTGPTNATVTSSGITTITFSGGSNQISLGSGAAISALSTTSPLSSFDLNNSLVTTQIQTDITKGAITGTLKTNASGAAIAPTNLTILYPALLSGTLSAFNIPAGVIINLDNFATPITVGIQSSSTTKNVIVAGTANFVNGTSGTTTGSGLIVSSSPATFVPTYPMLSDTGSLTSAGPMTIQVTNGVTTPAMTTAVITESAAGFITAQGALTISGNGLITLSGTVNSPLSTMVTANKVGATANSGNIVLGTFGSATSVNTIQVFGTGTITQGTPAITGSTFNFSAGSALTLANIVAGTLSFFDTAAVTVTDPSTSTVTVAGSPFATPASSESTSAGL